MPLYMWEMWDVTPVTNRQRKVGQYSVWAESAIIIFFKLSFWRWIWRNYKESQDERKGTTHKCQKEGKTLTLVQVRKMTPTFIGLVLNSSESKWQSTHRPWYPWSKKDPVRKLIIVQLLLSVRLCRKTEIKLRSWIWTTFLFWICFDDWKSLKKKIPKYLNLKTTFQERIWDCQQESLLVPGKTTISKNNQNYPPKWFFSLQINAKFGWRKLFGLMWKGLRIGARFAPNWKKRHQIVQKDLAQPQLSHHNYKLSLFPFCCRYFQTSSAKCR